MLFRLRANYTKLGYKFGKETLTELRTSLKKQDSDPERI